MGAFWGRFVGYILLGTALALAAGPFSDHRLGPPQGRAHMAAPVVVVEGLATGRLVAAGVLLLAGLWIMRGQYKRRPGFNVNPTWTAILVDLIIVLFVGMGSFILLEWLLYQWFGVSRSLDDDAVTVVTAMMYLPSLAILAGFACNASSQSLEVTAGGLTRHGPGRSRAIPWEQVQGIGLMETQLAAIRGGVALPRKFQTKLLIKFGEDDEITLFEPALKEIKRDLVQAMREQGPQRLGADLDKVWEGWRL